MFAGSVGGARQWKASIPKSCTSDTTKTYFRSSFTAPRRCSIDSDFCLLCISATFAALAVFLVDRRRAYLADMRKRGENLIKQAEITRFWVGNYQLQIAPRVIHCQCLCFVTTRAEKVCCSLAPSSHAMGTFKINLTSSMSTAMCREM